MPITEGEAIAAARAFAIERHGVWNEHVVSVVREDVRGIDCWLVKTVPAPAADEPDWSFEIDGDLTYLIQVTDGRCIGIWAGTAKHMF